MDTEGFISRFKQLLDENNISASALADEIGVQRSSISHILSGRNKPSLDFILKVLKKFPSINIYWLMNGDTSKYNSKNKQIEESKETPTTPTAPDPISEAISSSTKKIKHIVIFYEDATFERYIPN